MSQGEQLDGPQRDGPPLDGLRIAYLLADAGIPVGGTKGASIHVAEVCRALARRGARVLLLAQRVIASPGFGVEVVVLDPGPLPKTADGELARAAAAARFADEAIAVLTPFAPDLVYERLSLFFGQGARVAAAVGASARLVEVNAPVAAERARHFGLAHPELAHAAETEALHGADVLAVSDPVGKWAAERGAGSVMVVPNGADPDRFDPVRNAGGAGALRRVLGVQDAEVVGFAGSLKPWHGVEVLLEAVGLLAASRQRLRVVIVGEGPGKAALEALAVTPALEGRVLFVGAVDSADMPRWLGACDVVAAPYLPAADFYFSPLKVVEAMAAARPVVASQLPPVEEMLQDSGVLVEPGNAHALAQGLTYLLDDPQERARLGARGRACVLERGSWDAVAGRVIELATRLGAGRGRVIAVSGARTLGGALMQAEAKARVAGDVRRKVRQ